MGFAVFGSDTVQLSGAAGLAMQCETGTLNHGSYVPGQPFQLPGSTRENTSINLGSANLLVCQLNREFGF